MSTTNGTHRIDPLYGKKVAVLGFARQGQALARWLPTIGARVLVSDMRPAEALAGTIASFPDVEFVLGGHPESLLDDVAVLCVSGGVPLDLPIVRAAVEQGIRLSNDAQLFVERCPAPIIGITGSAGKTTTTTLTGDILKRAGETVWVGGNIGDVLLDVLPKIETDHIVVMELSSFQLELMTVSPHIGALLNITPNHLDRHGTMEAYVQAKAQIILNQYANDVAVLGRDDPQAYALGDVVRGELAWFSAQALVADGAFMAGQRLVVTGRASTDGGDPRVVCQREDIPLRGDHNVLNTLAACAITGVHGVVPEVMAAAIRDFKAVAHRLEVVRTLNEVTYVNDSIATAPERVLAALRSFTEPLVLLLGGRDKKLPWDEMLKLAQARSRQIILFGELAELVEQTAARLNLPADQFTRVQTLDEAVQRAAAVAQPGDVVLLSPGGTSYDAYVDFAARGEHFRRLVLQL